MSQIVLLKLNKVLPTLAGVLLSCGSSAIAEGPAVNVIRLSGTADAAPIESAPVTGASTGASAGAPVAPAASSLVPDAAGTAKLSAGTSVVHVELANVRDILLDVRRAKESASHLYGEVTRHPITSYNYVDSMGPVMMEIPMPTFDMSQVLPARKQWVDLYMNELNPIVAYVKADLDGIEKGEVDLSLPEKDRATFAQDLQACSASIDRAVSCGGQLKQLTVASPYDNVAIASRCSELHKELREVEKTTKKMIGQIKKSRQ